jgi:predicted metal-dependent hydrolase
MRAQYYDQHYLSYFERFNRQLFFEAHEALEALWLPQRQGPNGSFYKGLIQLAGGFVHLQKNRLSPAAALFKLARANLRNYPATHEGLEVNAALAIIEECLRQLESTVPTANPLASAGTLHLRLNAPRQSVDRRDSTD